MCARASIATVVLVILLLFYTGVDNQCYEVMTESIIQSVSQYSVLHGNTLQGCSLIY